MSLYDWQAVSETAILFFSRQSYHSYHSMTNRQWVILPFLPSPGDLWPTGGEWHSISICQPGSSHDQQGVSNSIYFLCHDVSSILSHPTTDRVWVMPHFQAVWWILSHLMTNRMWVIPLCSLCQGISSILILYQLGCEWHFFSSLSIN